MFPRLSFVSTLCAFLFCFGSGHFLPAQVNDASDTSDLVEAFEQKRTEFSEIASEISRLYIDLRLDSREERNRQVKKIAELKSRKIQLQLEIFEAAFEAVQGSEEVPETIIQSAKIFAKASFDGNGYIIPVMPEKTLAICNALRTRGVSERELLQLSVQAALAIQEFEKAKALVNGAVNNGIRVSDQMIQSVISAEKKWKAEQEQRAAENDLPTIRIQTTLGDIHLVLFEDSAPEGVKNFIHLIDSDFYNDLKFFSSIRGQNVRCGCPNNRGNGSPDYYVANEAALESARNHFRGSLTMMSVNREQWCASQFLLTQRPLPHLDGRFTVIGRVTEGLEVLDQLVNKVTAEGRELDDKPSIEAIEVTYRRSGTTYLPEKIEK